MLCCHCLKSSVLACRCAAPLGCLTQSGLRIAVVLTGLCWAFSFCMHFESLHPFCWYTFYTCSAYGPGSATVPDNLSQMKLWALNSKSCALCEEKRSSRANEGSKPQRWTDRQPNYPLGALLLVPTTPSADGGPNGETNFASSGIVTFSVL